MPRSSRNLTDNGYYHIFSRGNNKKIIFCYKEDYLKFLTITSKYLKKYKISIYHYCLMPNHFHFLLQAHKAIHLPKFMQGLLQSYSWHYRKKYNTVGFLFQNRYKSLFIGKESYLLECARYIERNPLRSGLVHDLRNYPWNSFSYYSTGMDDHIINNPNPCYLEMAKSNSKRQQRFLEYVLQTRPHDSLLDKIYKIE
ncbi:MAG: transposase [Acidobacteriota bacterium]